MSEPFSPTGFFAVWTYIFNWAREVRETSFTYKAIITCRYTWIATHCSLSRYTWHVAELHTGLHVPSFFLSLFLLSTSSETQTQNTKCEDVSEQQALDGSHRTPSLPLLFILFLFSGRDWLHPSLFLSHNVATLSFAANSPQRAWHRVSAAGPPTFGWCSLPPRSAAW
jgi:hypothetical protein